MKLPRIRRRRSVPISPRQQSLLNSSIRLHNGSGITSSPKLRLGRQGVANVFFYLALASTALGLGLLAYEGVLI